MTANNKSNELRGAAQLTIDAVTGITDLVEAVHATINSLGGVLGKPEQDRTTGITGMVYESVRKVSGLVGLGLDALLARLESTIGEMASSPAHDAVLSALNGVLGDHLAKRQNPLAISMHLRREQIPVTPNDPAFLELIRKSGKLVLLVHGSCMNDQQWHRNGHDHGAALARDLGYVPVYLLYNTGRHISENGRDLTDLLETFVNQLPMPLELVILAHSMGGLVSRSACHYGKVAGHGWLGQLQKLIFLGTPHHGAPLERGGNWIDVLLDISPYSKPFARLGKIRSAGVTDLRYGNIVDQDWQGRDRFKHSGDHRIPVPLPSGVSCYAVAGARGKDAGKISDTLIGDGLVTVDSAMGRHKNPDFELTFPEAHRWIGRGMNHLDLLDHPDVYQTLKQWL